MSNTNTPIPTCDPLTHKLCKGSRGCHTVQLLSHFANDRSKKDGKRTMCKGCTRTYRSSGAGKEARLKADRKYQAKPESRFKKYKRSAKERGYTWDMTFEDFMTFWQVPCTHCGTEIKTIGLDRLVSSVPYTKDNCQPSCSNCNRQKSDMDLEDWYEHMDSITTHRVKALGGSVALLGLIKETLKQATGEEHNETMYQMYSKETKGRFQQAKGD